MGQEVGVTSRAPTLLPSATLSRLVDLDCAEIDRSTAVKVGQLAGTGRPSLVRALRTCNPHDLVLTPK